MTQTSVEWIYIELVVFMTGNSDFESAEELFRHGKEMHKTECINFAEMWESGVPHDSKEDLYDEIFKNIKCFNEKLISENNSQYWNSIFCYRWVEYFW
jgi:hypothetical protein